MNDISLAEAVVITMRIAAMNEIQMNVEVDKPTLQMVLEFNGVRMAPAVESTPHANAMIFNSTCEGAALIADFMDDNSKLKCWALLGAHLRCIEGQGSTP